MLGILLKMTLRRLRVEWFQSILLIATIAIATSASIAVFALYSLTSHRNSQEVLIRGDISSEYLDSIAEHKIVESGALFKLDNSVDSEAFANSLRLQEPYFPFKAQIVNDSLIASELNELSKSFRENLLSLVLVSWLVCLFVILSASELSAAQIRRDTETLSLIGGSSQLWYYLLGIEGVFIASLGVALGFTLGFPVTELLLVNLETTLSGQYGVDFSFEKPSFGYLLGVVTALAVTLIGYSVKVSKRLLVFGFIFVSSLLIFFGYFFLAIIFALVLFLPQVFVAPLKLIPATTTFLIFKEFIARASAGSRLLLTSSALSICLLVGIAHFVSSFDRALFNWITSVLHGDVFIQSANEVNTEDARIKWFLRNFFVRHRFQDSTVVLNGAEFKKEEVKKSFVLLEGNLDRAKLASGEYVLVSEPASKKLELSPGDELRLLGRSFTVAGVYRDYARDIPTIAIEFDLLRNLTKTEKVDTISLALEGNSEGFIEDLTSVGVDAKSFSSLLAQVQDMFGQTFFVTRVLELVLILVTAIGCALSMVQHISRQKDSLSTFKTIGVSSFALFKGLSLVVLLWGLVASVIGGFSGIFLGWVLCEIINPNTFGWTIPFQFNFLSFLIPCVLVVVANLIASSVAFMTKLTPVRTYES